MDRHVGRTCLYCQFPIKRGQEVTVCQACGIPHHTACWVGNGGCTTFGCPGHAVAPPSAQVPAATIAARGAPALPQRPASLAAPPSPGADLRPLPRRPREDIRTFRIHNMLRGLCAGLIGGAIPGSLYASFAAAMPGAWRTHTTHVGSAIAIFIVVLAYCTYSGGLVGLFAGIVGELERRVAVGVAVGLCAVSGLVSRWIMSGAILSLRSPGLLLMDVVAGVATGTFVWVLYRHWLRAD